MEMRKRSGRDVSSGSCAPGMCFFFILSWHFEPSQSQRITSGLKETFIKRYVVERTNKAEIKPEVENEKEESCRENLWNEYS